METLRSIRSRWAAIGAAVAITLGAGGLATVSADSAESNFVAISPTRVLDTRYGVGMSGDFDGGTSRFLDVTGEIVHVVGTEPGGTPITSTGTIVPDGATAIVANLTAVRSTNRGYVAIRPGTATGIPTTSSLNIPGPGVVTPNAVTVALPVDGTVGLYYSAAGHTTDLILDIVGYYTQNVSAGPPSPVVRKSASTSAPNTGTLTKATASCLAGEVATGGGVFWISIPDVDSQIMGSYPSAGLAGAEAGDGETPDGWSVEVRNTGATSKNFQSYVICIASGA